MDWDFIHSVNLKATFFCCQQGAMLMREHGGGRIVNISSMGGIRPWPDHVHYCASKAGRNPYDACPLGGSCAGHQCE